MTIENARKLIGAGFADPLAKEIARAIDAGSEDYRRLMALGVPGLLAEAMADAIGGEDITAQRLTRLGMNVDLTSASFSYGNSSAYAAIFFKVA